MRIADGNATLWSIITDVHGAPGVSGWKQLVPGRTLLGPWEAIELARIPSGGVSGAHRHTRTNEIYFILAGSGEFTIDDRTVHVRPGYVAVTATGSTHALRNTGAEEMTWLVAEVPAARPSEETIVKPGFRFVDLGQIGVLDLTNSGVDPLQEVGVRQVAPTHPVELSAEDAEVFAYLIGGAATVTVPGSAYPIEAGTGITLGKGERATITAIRPAQLFWVRSAVEMTA